MHTLLYIVLCATTLARAGSAETASASLLRADCDAPVIQEAYATGPNAIYVAWNDLFGSPANTYALELVEAGSPPSGMPAYSGIDEEEFVAEGLQQGSLYDIYIRTECPDDTSSWYGPVQAATDIINGQACQIAFDITDNNCPEMQSFPVHVDLPDTLLLGGDLFLKYIDIIVEHPWLADLSITLISPSGIVVDLSSDNGVGAQNFGDPEDATCMQTLQFADFACVPVTDIEDDFSGQVQPEQPLSSVHDSTPGAGVWILQICDKASDDIGVLRYVELVFGQDGCTLPPFLGIVNETDTSANVHISISGMCDSVEIYYGPPGIQPGPDPAYVIPCGDSLATITGLQGGTEYVVFARARCGGDTSQWTCATPFSTTCSAPSIYSSFDNQEPCNGVCAETCVLSDTVWNNTTEDDTDWIIFTGSTPTDFTGPSATRNGVGNYLYMETSGLDCGDTTSAILQSACMEVLAAGSGCDMGFWYHMYGSGIGELHLAASTNGGLTWDTLWEKQGDQGDSWHFALVDLQPLYGQLAAFRFVATREDNFFSDFALDDVAFYGSMLADSTSMMYYADEDGDSFGNSATPVCFCTIVAPASTSDNALDCDDTNPLINPEAEEIPCNLIDDNCNNEVDEGDTNLLSLSFVEVTDASCAGIDDGAVEVAAMAGTPPYVFAWNTGDTTSTIEGLAPGLYSATITDFNGCAVETGNLEVALTEVLGYVPLDIDLPSCLGMNDGSIQGTGQGGTAPYSYWWSNGDTTAQAEDLADGVYTVRVTDANGCFTTDTISLESPPSFQVVIIQMEHVDCAGEATGMIRVQVSGVQQPVSYMWSNGDTSALADSLSTGHYSCTVTAADGCMAILPDVWISETEPVSITVDAVEPPLCADEPAGTIQITTNGGSPPYFYLWSNGRFTEDLFDVPSGTYSLSVTDLHGCQNVYSDITLSSPSSLEVQVDTMNRPRCPAGMGMIILEAGGGSPPYDYQWSNGAASADTLQGVPAGEYSVTVSDAFGCKAILRDIELEPMIEPLQLNLIGASDINCYGESTGAVSVEVTDGRPPFEFNWSIGVKHDSNIPIDSLVGLPAGSYSVTVTDSEGCVGSWDETILSQPPDWGFTVDSIMDVSCFGAADGAVHLSIWGATPPYNYLWSNGLTSQDLTALGAGQYSVAVEDTLGCVFSPPPFLVGQPDTVYMTFETLGSTGSPDGWAEVTVIGGAAPYSYLWDGKAAGQTTRRAVDLVPALYSVTVTDADDCMYHDTVRVHLVNAADNLGQPAYQVFPNPASDYFYIQGDAINGEVSLWNVSGRQIILAVTRMAHNSYLCHLPGAIPDGIYWIQIGKILTSKRIVIAGR